MEIIKKVKTIEVKKCFVISQLIRRKKGKSRYLNILSKDEFDKKLKIAKIKASKFSEKKLDNIIALEWKKRLKAYNNADWFIGEVSPVEVGVWKSAGGLPLAWTNGSLKETAQKVKYVLGKNPKSLKKRARHTTIGNMLNTNVDKLQDEKYLYPIIFQGGTGTNGRKKLKKLMKGDIDDGCMRSIALTIKGLKHIKAYLGFPKKIN